MNFIFLVINLGKKTKQIEHGADPNHKNNVGQSPKDYVIVQSDERMHKIFEIK